MANTDVDRYNNVSIGYMTSPPSAFSRRAVVSYWRKYVHEVLVNRLGGLSLPRKSVVRLTDRPDIILVVYRGRKTTMQQQQQYDVTDLHHNAFATRASSNKSTSAFHLFRYLFAINSASNA